MTPGLAKSRAELPHLYYPRNDRVIINAHNFTPPAAWTPANITTSLWLDASDSTTLFDATSGGSLPANNAAVARWQDKSGNLNHATQGTSGSRPLRKAAQQNGLDTLLFDGTDDWMTSATSPTTGNPKTVVAITKSTNASGGTVFTPRTTGRKFLARVLVLGGTNYISGDSTTTNVTTTFSLATPMQSYMLHSWRSPSGLAIEYRGNGNAKTTSGTILSDTGTAGYVVAANTSSGSQPWPGEICEIVVVDSYAATSVVEQIEGYLAWKWNTVSALDAAHPYKSAAP